MKFSCEKSILQEAISVVQKAINAQNTLAVLGNICMEAKENTILFSATNLEMAITTEINAVVESAGIITVPARIFANYISFLPETTVSVSSDGENILISTSQAKTKMKGISADEFPELPQITPDFSITLASDDLKKAVERIAFSCSASSARPVLSGALFWIFEGVLKIVGTDSYRLGEQSIAVESTENEHKCIVPARTLQEIGRISAKSPLVEILFSKNQIVFIVANTQLSSRLIEGNFPEYQRIIPVSSTGSATLSRNECILAVKRAGIFAKEIDNNTIKITIAGGNINIATAETEIGSGDTFIETKQTGSDGGFSLNAAFFLDALQVMGSDEIIMQYSTELAPVKILPKEEDAGFVHVIMPLKV